MHPLDGAYARLARAEEHLKELESINDGLVSELCNVGVKVLDKEIKQFPKATRTGSELIKFAFDQTATPPTLRIQVLVGETIYNLRAALDYFVYQLAILDSGRVQHYTQFPIERTPNKFRKRRDSYLKGVNDSHVEAIEKLQYYGGVKWLDRLQKISNPDKHRDLVLSEFGGALYDRSKVRETFRFEWP